MQVILRFLADSEEKALIQKHGLSLDGLRREHSTNTGWTAYYVPESDEKSKVLRRLESKLDLFITTSAEFTKEDCDSCEFLTVHSKSFSGFPQPEFGGTVGWAPKSFDMSRYCDACGGGLDVQVAPIRMKSEPKWSKTKQTQQLHWLHDFLFVSRNIYDNLFSKFGIDCWPVQSASGKITFENTVQLKWQEICKVEIPERYVGSTCKSCGTRRYLPDYAGFAPRVVGCDKHFVASDLYTGDGHESSRLIYVSQELYQAMVAAKVNCVYAATPPC